MNYYKKLSLTILAILLLSITALFSNLTVNSFIGSCEYKIGEGDWKALKVGDQVPETATIRVVGKSDSLELEFPDKSVVTIYGLTTVKVSGIMQKEKKGGNVVTLLTGKVFADVSKSDNQDFKIQTETAVAAVRGTKYGVSYAQGVGGNVVVTEGSVAVSDPAGAFKPVMVQKGMMSAIPATSGTAPTAAVPATKEVLEGFGPKAAAQGGNEGNKMGNISTPNIPDTKGQSSSGAAVPTEKKEKKECTKEGLNWSISSESIGTTLWNKALVSPTFKFGDFTFGLYLTMYIQNLDDVFNTTKWYNYDEWNFGFNTNNSDFDIADLAHDLMLKIKFMRYQSKEFLFAFGNIPDISIGHGSLVGGYANDLKFPSERVVGIQIGFDSGTFGMEAMMADVFMTKLMGMRVFLRPFFNPEQPSFFNNVAFGLSGFVDQDPLYNNTNTVWGYALDIDVPIFDFMGISATFYTDVATLGFNTPTTNSFFKGLGVFAGLKGTILIIDYKAEFLHLNGGFVPNYVDKFYDVNRSSKFNSLISDANTNIYNGFSITAGRDFDGIGGIYLGYQHYFDANPLATANWNNNYLHIEAYIDKCFIKNLQLPVSGYGSIAYDKANFAFEDIFNLSGGVLTTSLFYEVAEDVYIGMTYKKFFETDALGNLQEKQSFALETQMGL